MMLYNMGFIGGNMMARWQDLYDYTPCFWLFIQSEVEHGVLIGGLLQVFLISFSSLPFIYPQESPS